MPPKAFSSDVDAGSREESVSNKTACKRHHGVTQVDPAPFRTGRGDLTPLVYRRLFSQHPEVEAMF
jgi:hypothetical protein